MFFSPNFSKSSKLATSSTSAVIPLGPVPTELPRAVHFKVVSDFNFGELNEHCSSCPRTQCGTMQG